MNRWIRMLLAAWLLFGLATAAEAATRGGKMVYARYADSLFLDPVLNDANVDIWILTKSLRHAAPADGGRHGRQPRPRHRLSGVGRRPDLHPDVASGD